VSERGYRHGGLPGGRFPGGRLPGGRLPGGRLPASLLLGGGLPGGRLPGGRLPGGRLPGGRLPGGRLPASLLLGGGLPGGLPGVLPDGLPGGLPGVLQGVLPGGLPGVLPSGLPAKIDTLKDQLVTSVRDDDFVEAGKIQTRIDELTEDQVNGTDEIKYESTTSESEPELVKNPIVNGADEIKDESKSSESLLNRYRKAHGARKLRNELGNKAYEATNAVCQLGFGKIGILFSKIVLIYFEKKMLK
jgi:hypothetical protein